MKKSNKDIPLIYIYIYAKFKKHLPNTPFVRPSYLLEIIKRICRIPKALHYPILKEMEKLELIKRINHQNYEVLRNNCINKLSDHFTIVDRISHYFSNWSFSSSHFIILLLIFLVF